MQTTNPTLDPAAQRTLERWHAGVAGLDLSELPQILHPDAVFRSPMAHTPYEGAAAVHLILSTVITIFEDFTYHREFVSEDGRSVALEFSARVGDRSLKGVDLIEIDDEGLITDFEVMIRPRSGLQVLGERMAEKLAEHLPAGRS